MRATGTDRRRRHRDRRADGGPAARPRPTTVTVFEADDRIGGHTNTIRVDDPRGERWIDTGFIVHNDRNYPHFTALLGELGVETQAAEMGMSIAIGRRRLRVRQHPARAVRAALEPAAAAVLAADPRPAALQPRGPAARRAPRRADGRRVPARLGLLAVVLRARDRPRGLGGLVGRPARRSGSSRSASSPSSSTTTASSSSPDGRSGGRSPAARASYVERLLERFGDRVRAGAAGALDRAPRRRRRGSPPTGARPRSSTRS